MARRPFQYRFQTAAFAATFKRDSSVTAIYVTSARGYSTCTVRKVAKDGGGTRYVVGNVYGLALDEKTIKAINDGMAGVPTR